MERGAWKRQQKMVVVEHFRRELQAVAEGHATLDRKIDRVAEGLHQAIAGVDHKIDLLAGRVNQHDGRIDQVEQSLIKRMDAGFAEVVKLVSEFGTRLDTRTNAPTRRNIERTKGSDPSGSSDR